MVDGATLTMGNKVGNVNLLNSDFSYIARSPVSGKGATIEKKMGVIGTLYGEPGFDTLTAENLWPWPYESKIKELFSETNDPPQVMDCLLPRTMFQEVSPRTATVFTAAPLP